MSDMHKKKRFDIYTNYTNTAVLIDQVQEIQSSQKECANFF